MSRKRLTAVLVAGTLGVAAAATAAPASAEAKAAGHGHRSLAKVLAADGNRFDHNWSDFDIVDKAAHAVLAAKPHSPVGVLAKGKVRLTAFLPTDRAFRALVTDLTGKQKATERGVFRTIAKSFDADTIESVLLYHVVPGATITSKQAAKADGAKLDTALSGAKLTVNVTAKGAIRLQDLDPDDTNARVLPRLADINKGNRQVAHGINRVLRPVNL
jgi:uncharacterized surface protein with fasciclin (FAS1) repeats